MTIVARDGLRFEAAKKGHTITSLAAKVCLSRGHLTEIIHGAHTTAYTAGLIAKELGKTVEELFYIT